MIDVKPVAWQRFDELGEYDSYMGPAEEGDYVKYDDALATVTALQAEIEAMRKDAERSAIAVARMELIIDMCNADEEVCDEFQGVAELIAFKCQVSLDDMKDECAVDLLDAAIAKEKQPCADSK